MSKGDNNRKVADRLDNMELSEKARSLIANTDFNILYELFGDCENPEEIEEIVEDIIG